MPGRDFNSSSLARLIGIFLKDIMMVGCSGASFYPRAAENLSKSIIVGKSYRIPVHNYVTYKIISNYEETPAKNAKIIVQHDHRNHKRVLAMQFIAGNLRHQISQIAQEIGARSANIALTGKD
ncbi:MAG: hypothetical protein ABW092_11585 [Candidatus Thiodiazotropha sp.]